MRTLQINHLAVLVSVVVLSGFGALWYGPLLGDTWANLVGLDPENMEGPGAAIWITNFVATIIPVYAMAWLFTQMNVETLVKGALVGFIIGFAFIHLRMMNGNMWAGRPYELSWIDGGSNMISMTIAGAILGAWKKYSAT